MVRIQLNDRDMMRILTAAVREIKAEQKEPGGGRCSKERICNSNEEYHKKEKAAEGNP